MNYVLSAAAAQCPLLSAPRWPAPQAHGVILAPGKAPAPSRGKEAPPPQRCLPTLQRDAHTQGTVTSHQVFSLVAGQGTESHTSQRGTKGGHQSPEGGAIL